jgi:hypothetical protein
VTLEANCADAATEVTNPIKTIIRITLVIMRDIAIPFEPHNLSLVKLSHLTGFNFQVRRYL